MNDNAHHPGPPFITVQPLVEHEGYHGWRSFHAEAWHVGTPDVTVLVVELNNNPGTSVTNQAEWILADIGRRKLVRHGGFPKLVVFEAYEDRLMDSTDDVDPRTARVVFDKSIGTVAWLPLALPDLQPYRPLLATLGKEMKRMLRNTRR